MKALSVLCLLFFVAIAGAASADVMGMGAISWDVPQGTIFAYNSPNQAGTIKSPGASYQPLYLTLNNGEYTGSRTDSFNTISASVKAAGDISGNVTAKSNTSDPNLFGYAELDIHASFTYSGALSALPLSYSFSGQKDSVADIFVFRVQTEVLLNNERIYSDYTGGSQPVEFYVNNLNPSSYEGVFDYFEALSLDPNSSYSGEWYVSYEFEIIAYDFKTPNPVPLPSTLLLFGSGFLGLASWRRLKKG